ncbi:restriction endonuclease subunit S [bacterium]|nr:restriction endonuclease subunit S [bacterium]
MTPQELKNSILQLAIQGKLVPQIPEEGTAEELYQQIQAEKQKLIKEGIIRQDTDITEPDEYPFDIPDSWVMARITDCGAFISGFTPKPNELAEAGRIPYFKVSDMNTEGNEVYLSITTAFLKDDSPKKYFLKNTIVYPKNGGAVFTNKKRILVQDSIVDLNTGGYSVIGPVNLMYFYYFFLLIDFRQCYKGTALPTIDMDRLKRKWIPLPPLAEQKRIVAKIEELLPLIDRYEQAWSRLEEFNKRFPEDMKKSILQYAIQGKLVEQRPEEGTGEELYQQIQAEKQKLIKEGKIKKEKPLPEITEEEKPFEIPESWKWVRFSAVIDVRDGTHDTPKYVLDGIPLVTSKNLVDGRIDFETAKNISVEDATVINIRSRVDDGDILFAMIGTIGNPVIVKKDREFSIKNMALFKQIDDSLLDMRYVLFFLQRAQTDMRAIANASVQSFVSLTVLRNYLFPLPPLAEQKRIVAKLEELLELSEKLKK